MVDELKPDYLHHETKTETPQAEVWVTGVQAYPTGWVCPKCGRVYSPTNPICWYCGGDGTSVSISTNGGSE